MTIEAYIPKFGYLNTSLTSSNIEIDFANAKILELYGNAGTLLSDPENQFAEDNYTVFDYDEEAITQGKENFPNADFRMWDHHNQMNNPDGVIDAVLPFLPNEKFDIIFSYMKTSNLDPAILKNVLQESYNHLNNGGVIVFGAFIREVALNYFLVRRTHEYGMLEPTIVEGTEDANVFCLINNDELKINVDRVPTSGDDAVLEATHYTWFWNNGYLTAQMQEAFPESTVYTRRLPPMWSIHNPIVIKKP